MVYINRVFAHEWSINNEFNPSSLSTLPKSFTTDVETYCENLNAFRHKNVNEIGEVFSVLHQAREFLILVIVT